jgi:hypothetical protein
MHLERMAIVQGWGDTRAALRRWNAAPGAVLGPWLLGSLAVALTLLAATWVIAVLSVPDPTRVGLAGVGSPATVGDYLFILYRNGLVLALHTMACVAGFVARASLPRAAAGYSGVWRRLHDVAGPAAIAFVVAATLFSLGTQAYALGGRAASVAAELGMSPGLLLLALLPHALPELCALFLPLAAWSVAGRRGAWNELLAATFVTTALAAPVLLLAGAVEVWVSPHVLYFLK